jgi:hypothetical protein
MNAIRVSKRAGLRLGMALTAILLLAIPRIQAAEIIITVDGVVNGGRDMFAVFGMPKNIIPKDTPYTLVFTFDDAKGAATNHGPCASNGTGIVGAGPNSPGTAVLTINGKSFTFGRQPDARSRTWRAVASVCSNSEIGISVQEGKDPLQTAVNIKATANRGKALTRDKDWRGTLTITDFDARNGDNAFVIRHPGNYGAETMSYLSVSKVTVARGNAGAKAAPAIRPGFSVGH